MARTPTSTADCEAQLGPRNAFAANDVKGAARWAKDNRAWLNRWLTSQRMPYMFAAALSNIEAGLAYHDNGVTLDKVKAKLARALGEDDTQDIADSDAHSPAPAPRTEADEQAQKLKKLIEAICGGRQPALDVGAIRDLIKDEVPKHVHVQRHEFIINNETREVPGLTHNTLPRLMRCVLNNIPVFLVGPAGGGKTHAANQIADALGLKFYLMSKATGAHDIVGHEMGGKFYTTPYVEAFRSGGVLCLDEIDNYHPEALPVANASISNGWLNIPGTPEPIKKHPDFRIIAGGNTWGRGADRIYVGRNQLDGATIDRFAFLAWDYDEQLEAALCPNEYWLKRVQSLRHSAFEQKAQVVISPRASIMGAVLLANGESKQNVEEMLIWKGINSDTRARIENGAR